MPFPGPGDRFPTKDEMADYLESYAEHFALPVRSGVRVERLCRNDREYEIETTHGPLFAGQVVVAMATYQRPRVPAFAGELRNDIVQLHSSSYRNPSQLARGGVLVVGAGNSGAEIAMELTGDHRVLVAGRGTGYMPFRVDGRAARTFLLRWMLRGLFHHVFSVGNPMGRRIRSRILGRGGPLVRVRPRDLTARGVERVPRVVGTERGLPKLEDGRVLEVPNTIWCTGFHPGFDWIDLPAFGKDGRPIHSSGVSEEIPGLYFVGLHFLHALSSGMIHGVGRDAARIARAARSRATAVSRTGMSSPGEVLDSGLPGGTDHHTPNPTSRTDAACPS
jgi:putative flavoprotein involved in K+ transport